MIDVEPVNSPEEAADRADAPGLPPFEWSDIARHGADAHWRATRDGETVARCSLWWTTSPALDGQLTGVIGHYAAVDNMASTRLLNRACAELAGRGCAMAIGPMDGNTWRRYRALADRGTEPLFFLEPDNPDDWPRNFGVAGFTVLARYYSTHCADLTYADPRLARVAERVEEAGIQIRALNADRLEAELGAIHALSLVSFRENLLYTPIAERNFIEQYGPIVPALRPELVMLAELEGKLVGFLFAVPDLLQAKRGRQTDTIIVKTVAVLPGREYAGLGNLLAARSHSVASDMGFTRAIHALMHESNKSLAVSAHYGAPFRRYELYCRRLAIRQRLP